MSDFGDNDRGSSPNSGSSLGCRQRVGDSLELGPRKKACRKDLFVHHGRHFGRTIHALCQVDVVLEHGISQRNEGITFEDLRTAKQRVQFRVFENLLKVPGVLEKITAGDDDELYHCAELIQKGVACARSDDAKSLKGTVLEWIIPDNCVPNPPLDRNTKITRGFNHEITGALLCPAEMDWKNDQVQQKLKSNGYKITGANWPIFLYENHAYNSRNPWIGLLRGKLLVNGFKHIFTSPSSVGKEPKATRAGNARIHGMESVTIGSIAYVATQICFAISSANTFSRTDKNTDSERFYNTILELLTDPDEIQEVNELLAWWNQKIFGGSLATQEELPEESPLAQIRRRRAALKAATQANQEL